MSKDGSGLESIKIDKEKLARDILYGFHHQFAENQRTREQNFLKILGFLGAVIFGYAYVYNKLWQNIDEFSLVAIAGELILMFGGLVITTIAYNFRRDQYINARIRKSCGVLGNNKIFPEEFDPSVSLKNKRRLFTWMPNFLYVFFLIFPTFQIVLFASYATKLNIYYTISDCNGYVTFTFLSFVLSLSITIGFATYFYYRLRKKLGIVESE